MLSSVLNGGSLLDWLVGILYSIPAVVIALSFHEFAHGLAAYWLGDPTAKLRGRLTVNPKAHFDLYGTICMLLFGFGWANPVPFSLRNLKKPKRDGAIIALAGPLMNYIVALVFMVIYALLAVFFNKIVNESNFKLLSILLEIVYVVYVLNINLMVFNLIPIPPLDGSKILFSLLPYKSYNFILNFERYGFIILMFALAFGILDVPLNFMRSIAAIPIQWVGKFIFGLFV